LGLTLRYPYEVRNEAEYFEDIPELKLSNEMLDLATHSTPNPVTSIPLSSKTATRLPSLSY